MPHLILALKIFDFTTNFSFQKSSIFHQLSNEFPGRACSSTPDGAEPARANPHGKTPGNLEFGFEHVERFAQIENIQATCRPPVPRKCSDGIRAFSRNHQKSRGTWHLHTASCISQPECDVWQIQMTDF